ncbi:unnamed protein product [Amoebophrya sp. A120]|nr:unnamed protein product [Amoebophrya sp. A120]|eukprot:GSA120T00002316001.1
MPYQRDPPSRDEPHEASIAGEVVMKLRVGTGPACSSSSRATTVASRRTKKCRRRGPPVLFGVLSLCACNGAKQAYAGARSDLMRRVHRTGAFGDEEDDDILPEVGDRTGGIEDENSSPSGSATASSSSSAAAGAQEGTEPGDEADEAQGSTREATSKAGGRVEEEEPPPVDSGGGAGGAASEDDGTASTTTAEEDTSAGAPPVAEDVEGIEAEKQEQLRLTDAAEQSRDIEKSEDSSLPLPDVPSPAGDYTSSADSDSGSGRDLTEDDVVVDDGGGPSSGAATSADDEDDEERRAGEDAPSPGPPSSSSFTERVAAEAQMLSHRAQEARRQMETSAAKVATLRQQELALHRKRQQLEASISDTEAGMRRVLSSLGAAAAEGDATLGGSTTSTVRGTEAARASWPASGHRVSASERRGHQRDGRYIDQTEQLQRFPSGATVPSDNELMDDDIVVSEADREWEGRSGSRTRDRREVADETGVGVLVPERRDVGATRTHKKLETAAHAQTASANSTAASFIQIREKHKEQTDHRSRAEQEKAEAALGSTGAITASIRALTAKGQGLQEAVAELRKHQEAIIEDLSALLQQTKIPTTLAPSSQQVLLEAKNRQEPTLQNRTTGGADSQAAEKATTSDADHLQKEIAVVERTNQQVKQKILAGLHNSVFRTHGFAPPESSGRSPSFEIDQMHEHDLLPSTSVAATILSAWDRTQELGETLRLLRSGVTDAIGVTRRAIDEQDTQVVKMAAKLDALRKLTLLENKPADVGVAQIQESAAETSVGPLEAHMRSLGTSPELQRLKHDRNLVEKQIASVKEKQRKVLEGISSLLASAAARKEGLQLHEVQQAAGEQGQGTSSFAQDISMVSKLLEDKSAEEKLAPLRRKIAEETKSVFSNSGSSTASLVSQESSTPSTSAVAAAPDTGNDGKSAKGVEDTLTRAFAQAAALQKKIESARTGGKEGSLLDHIGPMSSEARNRQSLLATLDAIIGVLESEAKELKTESKEETSPAFFQRQEVKNGRAADSIKDNPNVYDVSINAQRYTLKTGENHILGKVPKFCIDDAGTGTSACHKPFEDALETMMRSSLTVKAASAISGQNITATAEAAGDHHWIHITGLHVQQREEATPSGESSGSLTVPPNATNPSVPVDVKFYVEVKHITDEAPFVEVLASEAFREEVIREMGASLPEVYSAETCTMNLADHTTSATNSATTALAFLQVLMQKQDRKAESHSTTTRGTTRDVVDNQPRGLDRASALPIIHSRPSVSATVATSSVAAASEDDTTSFSTRLAGDGPRKSEQRGLLLQDSKTNQLAATSASSSAGSLGTTTSSKVPEVPQAYSFLKVEYPEGHQGKHGVQDAMQSVASNVVCQAGLLCVVEHVECFSSDEWFNVRKDFHNAFEEHMTTQGALMSATGSLASHGVLPRSLAFQDTSTEATRLQTLEAQVIAFAALIHAMTDQWASMDWQSKPDEKLAELKRCRDELHLNILSEEALLTMMGEKVVEMSLERAETEAIEDLTNLGVTMLNSAKLREFGLYCYYPHIHDLINDAVGTVANVNAVVQQLKKVYGCRLMQYVSSAGIPPEGIPPAKPSAHTLSYDSETGTTSSVGSSAPSSFAEETDLRLEDLNGSSDVGTTPERQEIESQDEKAVRAPQDSVLGKLLAQMGGSMAGILTASSELEQRQLSSSSTTRAPPPSLLSLFRQRSAAAATGMRSLLQAGKQQLLDASDVRSWSSTLKNKLNTDTPPPSSHNITNGKKASSTRQGSDTQGLVMEVFVTQIKVTPPVNSLTIPENFVTKRLNMNPEDVKTWCGLQCRYIGAWGETPQEFYKEPLTLDEMDIHWSSRTTRLSDGSTTTLDFYGNPFRPSRHKIDLEQDTSKLFWHTWMWEVFVATVGILAWLILTALRRSYRGPDFVAHEQGEVFHHGHPGYIFEEDPDKRLYGSGFYRVVDNHVHSWRDDSHPNKLFGPTRNRRIVEGACFTIYEPIGMFACDKRKFPKFPCLFLCPACTVTNYEGCTMLAVVLWCVQCSSFSNMWELMCLLGWFPLWFGIGMPFWMNILLGAIVSAMYRPRLFPYRGVVPHPLLGTAVTLVHKDSLASDAAKEKEKKNKQEEGEK